MLTKATYINTKLHTQVLEVRFQILKNMILSVIVRLRETNFGIHSDGS